MPPKKLVLSSSSKSRQNLLLRLQIPFETISPNVDENPIADETAQALATRLAREKAFAAAKTYPNHLIIGCDQVGVLENEFIGKPHTFENAYDQLVKSAGKQMDFYIGLCVLNSNNMQYELTLDHYSVCFRKYTHEEIVNYLKKEQPYEAAGSCNAEGLGITLIEKFKGDDFTALVGLPLIHLTTLLKKFGLDPLTNI
jgi:MAF protein